MVAVDYGISCLTASPLLNSLRCHYARSFPACFLGDSNPDTFDFTLSV
jgi:hypothetical protein